MNISTETLHKKLKEVIVPGANLKDPIPKHVTNK